VVNLKILVTGFEPFDDLDDNPTGSVLKLLPKTFKSHTIKTMLLPVVYDEAFITLQPVIDVFEPHVILSLGYAHKRTSLSIERVAINVWDSRISDNKNNHYQDRLIKENGPVAYFSTLKVRALVDGLNEDINTSISNSAGTYVCNDLMYQMLYYIDQNNLAIDAGFIHVPPSIDDTPLSMDTLKKAILKIIDIQCQKEG
jgi:pyroglutamyl-peptidase